MKFITLLLLTLFVSAPLVGAETALTVTTLSDTAVATPFEDVDTSNGNEFANRNGDVVCEFYNANGSAQSATVTIEVQNSPFTIPGFGAMTKSAPTVALSAGDRKVIGPFAQRIFNDPSGNVEFATSGAASGDVDVACMKVPRS